MIVAQIDAVHEDAISVVCLSVRRVACTDNFSNSFQTTNMKQWFGACCVLTLSLPIPSRLFTLP